MPDVTPVQLSLELNTTQKRIRDILRSRYGVLESGGRWLLTEAQANMVRERLRNSAIQVQKVWTLFPGDKVRRREIHAAYGGSQQGGIVTSTRIRDILVFTDVRAGARYGYHTFEGLRENGAFAYTGQGQKGNQEFTRGNLALRDSGPNGRPIRLFTVEGPWATYVGAFATGDPTCWIETIPDLDGNPRDGIIFNLIPLDANVGLLSAQSAQPGARAHIAAWSPPDPSDIIVIDAEPRPPGERIVSRIEFALQVDFGEWLQERGDEPERLQLSSAGITIEPDLYVRSTGWIVEAKRSSAREFVRLAIGQVLDYINVAEAAQIQGVPVVLLPGRPTSDLVRLLHRHGITLAVRDEEGFEIMPPPSPPPGG